MMRADFTNVGVADVAAALARDDIEAVPDDDSDWIAEFVRGRMTPAAVLCPLIERPEGVQVLLTRRSRKLSKHAGQISFPGGRIESSDESAISAALREAREEIGLDPTAVRILGVLPSFRTGTGFHIHPCVGVAPGAFKPDPDKREVEGVFEAPLAFLLDPRNRRPMQVRFGGKMRKFISIPYREHDIWGATAGILKSLSDRLAAHLQE